ncbi:hypothetical protein [Phycicoccus jejuensis]|uniref:hypothetical protein n=1 Tax=Phycicoccus jejuensis TaxID=367299 RepID=UPI0004C4502D|nr:hypothetical protein [Phycicoccus jejuensis]
MMMLPLPTLYPEAFVEVLGQHFPVTISLSRVLVLRVGGDISVGRSSYLFSVDHPLEADGEWSRRINLHLGERQRQQIADSTYVSHHSEVLRCARQSLRTLWTDPSWHAAVVSLCAWQEVGDALGRTASLQRRVQQSASWNRVLTAHDRRRFAEDQRLTRLAEAGVAFPGHALPLAHTLLAADQSRTVHDIAPAVHAVFADLDKPCPHGRDATRAYGALTGCLDCARHLGGIPVEPDED